MRPCALSRVLGRKGVQKEREKSPHPQEAGPSLSSSKREQNGDEFLHQQAEHRKALTCSSDHSDSQGELACWTLKDPASSSQVIFATHIQIQSMWKGFVSYNAFHKWVNSGNQ